MPEPNATAPQATLIPSTTVVAPGERFSYEVRNTDTSPIGFGEPYRLERLRNGEWQPCQVRLPFRLPLYILEPGDAKTLTAYVPGEVEPGRYRLVKEIRPAGEVLPPASDGPRLDVRFDSVEVGFEFDVVAPEL